jgi:hypothetical protein
MVTLISLQRKPVRCLVILVLALFFCFGQGRLRPPDNVGCERNDLTSYTGSLAEFSRSKTHVLLVIRTDADTIERVNVPNEKIGDRALKNGDRLTAWVCKSGAVTIQWLSPSQQR